MQAFGAFQAWNGARTAEIRAYAMNDELLPSSHGAPVRLVVPGIYGMKNVKWLTEIEATDEDSKGFRERRGWSDIAVINTMSRIDVPDSLPQEGTRSAAAHMQACGAFQGWNGERTAEIRGKRPWEATPFRPLRGSSGRTNGPRRSLVRYA